MLDDAAHRRLLPNVISGWLAQAVTLVVGFVMPRLIDHAVGPAALGVWDLGWSLTTYLTFSGFGMAAAITHNVARYTSEDAVEPMQRTIATGFYCQLALALALGSALAGLFLVLPTWAPAAFGTVSVDMHRVGIYLGLAVVTGLVGDVAQGVLTGCHRTSWNEYPTIGADLVLAAAMILVLLWGGGIVGLAMTTLWVRVLSELLRFALACVACPHTSVRPALFRADDAGRLIWFSSKTSLGVLREVAVNQGVRVLLAVGAGPAALACYSRYQTIVRQIGRLMERSTRVLPPIASGLAGQGRKQALARLHTRASKATVMASLPMIVVFAVFGDDLIRLWMGRDFVVPGVAWVLALMAVVHLDYGVSSRILSSLDAHGRIAIICFALSAIVFGALYLALGPLTVLEAAWMLTVVVGVGVSVPHYFFACARIGTSPWGHFKDVYLPALLVNSLFLLGLSYVHRLAVQGAPLWAATAATSCLILLFAAYWYFAVSQTTRNDLLRLLRTRGDA